MAERVAVSTAVSCQTGPMPSGLADREGIQGNQIAWSSGEVAEPEGSVFGLGCEDAGGGGGELSQGGHPLGPAAEPMTPQELLDTGGRQADPAVGKVVDQPLGADGGSGDRLGQHRLDLVRWGGGRHDRWPATLGQQRSQPVALRSVRPPVGAGPRDTEGTAGRGHAGPSSMVEDPDAAVVDDLCWVTVVDS
jgi:hypothetical protein